MREIFESGPAGQLMVDLAYMANRYDDYSENMLNKVMCTDTCPCFQAATPINATTIGRSSYSKYRALKDNYLHLFGRSFEPREAKQGEEADIPFVWSTDRSKSVESLWECYRDLEHKYEAGDDTIDLKELFNIEDLASDKGYKGTHIDDIQTYLDIEDSFKCSGMCRPSLFYFGRNITEDAYPDQTCLHEIKKYMMENGIPYSTCCGLLTFASFWLTLSSICLSVRKEARQQ